MKNSITFPGFVECFQRLMSERKHAEAVNLIHMLARQATDSGKFKGEILRLPELDAALIEIANLMRPLFPPAPAAGSEHVCLVTEVYKTGGHRTILNSVCEEIPSHVIFTDVFDLVMAGKVSLQGLVTPKALSSITLNPDTLLEKVRGTVNLLNSLSPKRVWLFNHHSDVVAILAALVFDGGRRSVFVHHGDHDPALGATISFPVHFDMTDELLENCASIGLKPSRLALHTRPASHRAPAIESDLVVATAGSINKFMGSMRGIQYPEVVRTILQHPRVTDFHHIGEVPAPYVAEFKAFLASAGIDPERMKFAGQVPRVSDHLLSVGANVYLSSFPLGAGTTSAEVQSAGIPVIHFDPSQDEKPLCAIASVYASPELMWSELKSLHPIVDRVTGHWKSFSDAACQKYLDSFSRKALLSQLEVLR